MKYNFSLLVLNGALHYSATECYWYFKFDVWEVHDSKNLDSGLLIYDFYPEDVGDMFF
jgi:hypothetical protein